MRLSAREQELLKQLHSGITFGDRILGRAPDRVAILHEIASSGNIALVAPIAPWIFNADASLASAAAAAVDALLRSASDDALAELDHSSRRYGTPYGYAYDNTWRTMKPEAISGFHRFGESELSVVGFATLHGNGWVREAAVTRIDELRSSRAIPFLLLRVGDWVASIAERARTAFERHIVVDESDELLAHIPLLLRVTARRRRDTSELREQVFTVLREHSALEELAKARQSHDPMLRRVAFRLSVEGTRVDRLALLTEAVYNPDTAIRLEAIVQARSLDRDGLLGIVAAFLADPFPKVRHHALVLAIECLGQDAHPFILSALVDENRILRATARHAARERALVSDFVTYYRERATVPDSPRRVAAAVRGLAEVGTTDDVLIVVQYLASDQQRVRAAAVYATAHLDESTALEQLPKMLGDPAAPVTRAVRDSLRPLVERLGATKIALLLEDVVTKHGRRDAFHLAMSLGKWDALPLIIECAADTDEDIRTLALMALRRWLDEQNRTFVQPTRQQLQLIEGVLQTRRLALQRSGVDELRSILRLWSS